MTISKLLATCAALALASGAAVVHADSPPPPPAAAPASGANGHYGAWGVDLTNRDTGTKPGDDFEKHASGKWLDSATIPGDRASIGSFLEVYERTQNNLKKLITESTGTKYGAFYASFLDEKTIEARGLKPLMADIAKVRTIKNKRDFTRYMGSTGGAFGISIVDLTVEPDTADPTMNVLWVYQNGIGMPERDYYLTAQFAKQREAYQAYMVRTLKTIGDPSPAKTAAAIMAFETAMAEKSWTAADRRDVDKVNNPLSSAELAAYAPGVDWDAYFAGAGIPAQKRMLVAEKSAVRDLAAIYAKTPLTTLKAWQAFHLANQASPWLGKAMVESRFDYTKTISGVSQILPRWKRAVALVDRSLGELVGQDYINLYFPPAAKAKMESLVGNLKVAMAGRIQTNAWMSPPTKDAALTKLSRMDVMVGYPDKFRDYSALKIDAADLYGNVQRSGRFNNAYAMSDLGKPVDRKKWAMNPQTINAYNGGLENKIVFPAGILQAPFFDLSADDAVNYGAIGAVIGHEISHGFDDQGRKIDATGAVRDWWTKDDAARFEKEAGIFGAQYGKFEAAPGAFIKPALTMGENIADFAGIQVALDAYHRSLDGKEAPVIDGLTGDQRFFLAYAQAWRDKQREDATRNQVTSDPHSPARFRVLGPLRNVEAWYKAFDVKPGDKMYIAPEDRAKIW